MKRVFLLLTACFVLSVYSSGLQGSDELIERARNLKEKAARLAEQGDKKGAELLHLEARELMRNAEARKEEREAGSRGKIEDVKRRLADLLEKEKALRESGANERQLDEIRRMVEESKRFLQKLQSGDRPEAARFSPDQQAMAEKFERGAQRIRHMREAAEHLKLADMVDVAEQIFEKAASMEKEMSEFKRRMAEELERSRSRAPAREEMESEMRREIERLRDEVRDLRKQMKDR